MNKIFKEVLPIIHHDGEIHYPPGGGSYVFEKDYINFLCQNISKDSVKISIGAQPNSSPHFGTLIVFSLAFAIAQRISEVKPDIRVTVLFEVVDTAPAKSIEYGGIEYQKSLRIENVSDMHLPDYIELLDFLTEKTKVNYDIRKQAEFNSHKEIPKILTKILDKRDTLGPILDPKHNKIRIRIACPECGLTDKNGIKNVFLNNTIKSYCPKHQFFETSIIDESNRFEYNTPLRNLIRALLYSTENLDANIPYEWIRLTGRDYAGFYQEQLLYKTAALLGKMVNELPMLIYSPLVMDWSGAKLSKSLYVKENAYSYLPEYLLSYDKFKKEFNFKGIEILYEEVLSWVDSPKKLFRNYSIYYFMRLF